MLPSPHTCFFLSFNKPVALFAYINKCYISVINLRLFVKKFKDTVCTCKCHNNWVKLLADLIDRLGKALVECEEAYEFTDCKSEEVVESKDTTYDCTKYIADVTDLCVNRHKDICKLVCVVWTVEKPVIKLIEFFNALFFMVKYFYNLLTGNSLFNVTIQITKRTLLFTVITGTSFGNTSTCLNHNRNHDNGKKSKPDI